MTFDKGMLEKAFQTMLDRGILVEVDPGRYKLGDPHLPFSSPTTSTAQPKPADDYAAMQERRRLALAAFDAANPSLVGEGCHAGRQDGGSKGRGHVKPLLILPDRVPCIALNQPYAGLLFNTRRPGEPGRKSIETRLRPYPYEPGWLAIYATKNPDQAAMKRLAHLLVSETGGVETTGAIVGIVWIDGSRLMTADDSDAACYPFDPTEEQRVGRPRMAWPITAAHAFLKPDHDHLYRGPQNIVFLPRSIVAIGLWGTADEDPGQLALGLS